MIRVFYDAGALFIDGRDDPLPAATLVASAADSVITIQSIHASQGAALVVCDVSLIADSTGAGFASVDAALAYLAGQFAMRPQGGMATYTAAAPVFGGHAVMYAGAGAVEHADPTQAGYVFAGIALQGVVSGAPVLVQKRDAFAFSVWSWEPGEPVFALPGGALTQSPPDAGVCHEIGAALDATTLLITPRDPVYL